MANIDYLGQRDYSMRAWLDPDKMASLGLAPTDVVNAINAQNMQVAAGQIGQQPVPRGQQFQLTINTLGRLVDPEQFGDIIVKVGPAGQTSTLAGSAASSTSASPDNASSSSAENSSQPPVTASIVRLKDIARIELGSQQYDQSCTLDGKPSVALSIYQLPGSNALQTARGVYEKMDELEQRFPEGLEYKIVYDTTPFIHESIIEVFKTLRDAIILVAIVVLVFLQNWRAALIPLVAVPVAIIGTFAVMAALGFSLNNISLFGLVLAIGIVVDDAIVVVENVERWLEHGLAPRDAARKAMDEVTGPVIAVALVLCAVFVPCAFISGITGQFFRQFAVTIAVSTVISAFNSLTLSPAMAAILLKPHGAKRDPLTWLLDVCLGWFFRLFNWPFNAGTTLYVSIVAGLLRGQLLGAVGLRRVAGADLVGIHPRADRLHSRAGQGLFAAERAIARLGFRGTHSQGDGPDRNDGSTTAGRRPHGRHLRPIAVAERQRPESRLDVRDAQGICRPPLAAGRTKSLRRLQAECQKKFATPWSAIFGAPPIEGLGTTGGFKMIVEDRGNLGLAALAEGQRQIVAEGNATPGLEGLFNSSRANTPWLYLDIDRTKCMTLGLSMSDVFTTLQVYLGSYYVNNFNDFGRSWQVNVMADRRISRSHFENRAAQGPQ